MFQALPFVESGGVERFGFTGEELALCTASHGGEPFHVAATRSMLEKARFTEAALACGPQAPMHVPAADALRLAGLASSRLHNNCSGQHAGMLAFTSQQEWATSEYHTHAHPTQQRIRAAMATWMGVSESSMPFGIDGCGLPTFALPLDAVARGCARFAAAAADGQPAPAALVSAMTTHPEYVAGTDRMCTDLMRAAQGRLFAKVGAEGYYCAGVPAMRLGVAIKVDDGAWRAVEPARRDGRLRLRAVRGLSQEGARSSITGKSLTMRITSKGQVTIPQDIREKLGLLPHTEVEFTIERGRAVLSRKKGTPSRGEQIVKHLRERGEGKMNMSSKELMALLRDEPDELDAD